MNQNDVFYLLALRSIDGLGPILAKNLIAYAGSAEAIFKLNKSQIAKIPLMGKLRYDLLENKKCFEKAEEELKLCDQNAIEILTYHSQKYPKLLSFAESSPIILFKKGNIDFNAQIAISIVGTRKASEYGREITREFAKYFSEHGINVVSGLAYGIDYEAHSTVVQNNGITTACVAHGLSFIYPPQHKKIADQIQENGALLTEFGFMTKLDSRHFPSRNRIISGLSKATIVIESAKKGGALITAKFAFDQNREVYAVPGKLSDKKSAGCNDLIKNNIAKLITSPKEVLDDLGLTLAKKKRPVQLQINFDSLDESAKRVVMLLKEKPMQIDELHRVTNIPTGELLTILLDLEFKNIVSQLPGDVFKLRI